MAGEWETRRIGDLGRVVTGKTPSTAVAENFGGNYPFITIPDMDGRREISTSARTLSEQGAQSLRTCRLPAGAVMMSCIATIGNCGITTRPSFTNQQINSLICGDEANPKFVYYCFTQLGHALEAAGGGGSVYTNVSKSRFEEIELTLPPLPEQKAIAAVLGALDDKIELNRRMNATLEAMARALFQSWFVDFDPVRAKLDGRQPIGMDKATAALFSDSFQDSPIGHIPGGWDIRPLAEAFDIKDGATFKNEDRLERGNIIAFGANGPIGFSTRANVTEPCIALGKIGSCGSLHRSWNPCWVTNNAFIVRPHPGGSLEFLWRTLCAVDFTQFIGGSANPYMPLKNFGHTPIVMPPVPLLHAYQERAGILAAKMVANDEQSRTLATLRDTLLPKLLSGELNAPNQA